MKKKILRGTGFLAGLLAILIVLSAFMAPENDVYNSVAVDTKKAALDKEVADTIDVVFCGDSEAYSSFYPAQIWKEKGFTSYICANSLQRLCDTYELIRYTFETQSPKVVIIEANCVYRYPGIEKDSDDVTTNYAERLLPVLKYHSRWKSLIFKSLSGSENPETDYLSKGFKLRNGVKAYDGGDYMKVTDKAKEIPEDSIEYLAKIQELCKENGAELLLVSVPSPVNWSYKRHNGIQNYADEHGLTYIDMNLMTDELKIDWCTDTKDKGNHLNIEGAKKVTAYMAKYLGENYELEDHRGDEKYSHWDELECVCE